VSHYRERSADRVVDAFLEWLDARDAERPVFAWLHLFDPHAPSDPPARYRIARYRTTYYAEVAFVDDELARVFAALERAGLDDETLVLVVADHGEGLGEHDEDTHGVYTGDTSLRTPFLLRRPDGARAGERSDELVSGVDVFPTLADAMGLLWPDDVDGLSLLAGGVPADRGAYFESVLGFDSYGWAPIAGWVDAHGKYVESAERRFYDLAADPQERFDASAEHAAEIARARERIAAVAARPVLPPDERARGSDALARELRALGYAGAGGRAGRVPGPLDVGGLPSPFANASVQKEYLIANDLLDGGKTAEATALLESLRARDPRNPVVLERLGLAFLREGRVADAL
jgi:arylsulfatase A-like enzyme